MQAAAEIDVVAAWLPLVPVSEEPPGCGELGFRVFGRSYEGLRL